MQDKSNFNFLNSVNEIDIRQLLAELWSKRWFIIIITAIFFVFGSLVAITKRPSYETNALIQVNLQNNPLTSLSSVANLVSSVTYGEQHSSQADVESTLIQSRYVLGPVVDKLGLDIHSNQNHFPLIGRLWTSPNNIKVSHLTVPENWQEKHWRSKKSVKHNIQFPILMATRS